MKYLLILILLSGCNYVQKDFPPVPEELKVPCEELALVPKNTEKLSQVLDTVTTNYSKYHECKLKTETWIDWYKEQQKNFYIQ